MAWRSDPWWVNLCRAAFVVLLTVAIFGLVESEPWKVIVAAATAASLVPLLGWRVWRELERPRSR